MSVNAITIDPAQAISVIGAYRRSYAMRIDRAADGTAFTRPEPNALTALWLVRMARDGVSKHQSLEQILDVLPGLTAGALEDAGKHEMATDISGFVWAEAYGLLPLESPPLTRLELVLESGSGPRAIVGLLGAIWRVAFLGRAVSLFTWRYRERAEQELVRWSEHLRRRVEAFLTEGVVVDAAAVSQRGRIAYSLGQVMDVFGEEWSREQARLVSEPLLGAVDLQDGKIGDQALSTAHLAQLALGFHAGGLGHEAQAAVALMLGQRRVGETQTLASGPSEPERTELSPWVPMALQAVHGGEAPSHGAPRGLRRLFARVPRSA